MSNKNKNIFSSVEEMESIWHNQFRDWWDDKMMAQNWSDIEMKIMAKIAIKYLKENHSITDDEL